MSLSTKLPIPPRNVLEKTTLRELVDIARLYNIKGVSKKKKADLINILLAHESAPPVPPAATITDSMSKIANSIKELSSTVSKHTEMLNYLIEKSSPPEEPDYDSDSSDCSINSDMTEYCLTRKGLRKRNMPSTHRDIVRHTKDGSWFSLAYD